MGGSGSWEHFVGVFDVVDQGVLQFNHLWVQLVSGQLALQVRAINCLQVFLCELGVEGSEGGKERRLASGCWWVEAVPGGYESGCRKENVEGPICLEVG